MSRDLLLVTLVCLWAVSAEAAPPQGIQPEVYCHTCLAMVDEADRMLSVPVIGLTVATRLERFMPNICKKRYLKWHPGFPVSEMLDACDDIMGKHAYEISQMLNFIYASKEVNAEAADVSYDFVRSHICGVRIADACHGVTERDIKNKIEERKKLLEQEQVRVDLGGSQFSQEL